MSIIEKDFNPDCFRLRLAFFYMRVACLFRQIVQWELILYLFSKERQVKEKMKLFCELVGPLYVQDNFSLNLLNLGDHDSCVIVYVFIQSSWSPIWHIPLQLIHSIHDSICKVRDTHFFTRGNALQIKKTKCNVSFYYTLKLCLIFHSYGRKKMKENVLMNIVMQ